MDTSLVIPWVEASWAAPGLEFGSSGNGEEQQQLREEQWWCCCLGEKRNEEGGQGEEMVKKFWVHLDFNQSRRKTGRGPSSQAPPLLPNGEGRQTGAGSDKWGQQISNFPLKTRPSPQFWLQKASYLGPKIMKFCRDTDKIMVNNFCVGHKS